MELKIVEKHLPEGGYFKENTLKDTIYLHHNGGSYRPDWVIDWWNRDKDRNGNKIRVSSSYVIGGKSIKEPRDLKWDGLVYEAFSPIYWAHHLGLKSRRNTFLNQKSIGIELCNYGQLIVTNDNRFFTTTKIEVPETEVIELDSPFRGFKYYHKYTDFQIESLGMLLNKLSNAFDIDISRGLKNEIIKENLNIPLTKDIKELQRWLNNNKFRDSLGMKINEDGIEGRKTIEAKNKVGESAFGIKQDALDGYPGIWSHSSVRKDIFDISPQPNMINLLKSF